MNESLVKGLHGFSGRLVVKVPAKPKALPAQYVMQPFEIKLTYLQLTVDNEGIDLGKTRVACMKLFAYRKLQAWPPTIESNENRAGIYDAQKAGLHVLDSVDDAVSWTNDLIRGIDGSRLR